MVFATYRAAARACLKNASFRPGKATAVFVVLASVLLLAGNYLPRLLIVFFPSLLVNTDSLSNTGTILCYAVTVLCILLILLLFSGYTNYAMQMSRGSDASLGDILCVFRHPGRALSLSAIVLVVCYFSLMLFIYAYTVFAPLSLIPLILAGLIFYRYRFSFFVLFDYPEKNPAEVLRTASVLTSSNRMNLFRLDLSFLWFFLLSVVLPAFVAEFFDLIPSSLLSFSVPSAFQDYGMFLLALLLFSAVNVWQYPHVMTTYACVYNELSDRMRMFSGSELQ